MAGPTLSNYHRLIIKIGSSLLVDDNGILNTQWLASLAADLAWLAESGHELLIVSSGAIAIGSPVLGISRSRARLEDLQAAAATGQVQLVLAYQEALGDYQRTVAQVLLTPADTEDRRRFLNARGTLRKLLDRGVIPIINENDTVATEEIRYGDNDRLAARVAQLVMADALLLLSDVDGLYSADPRVDAAASHIPLVQNIDDKVIAIAGKARSVVGSGGMETKVQAAKIANHAGCATIVCSGTVANPLRKLANGGRHTLFAVSRTPAAARKQWLAGLLDVAGAMRLDDGAVAALGKGGSLLPVGVMAVEGYFSRGDVVALVNARGKEVGRGLAEYSDAEASLLCGCQSDQIENRLGYSGRAVMMHRDELVVFDDD
jgi:glutamate 5-kinase